MAGRLPSGGLAELKLDVKQQPAERPGDVLEATDANGGFSLTDFEPRSYVLVAS